MKNEHVKCWWNCSLVFIWSTFQVRPFHLKVFFTAFLYLQFGFEIFWQNNIVKKASCKMLIKLTKGWNHRSGSLSYLPKRFWPGMGDGLFEEEKRHIVIHNVTMWCMMSHCDAWHHTVWIMSMKWNISNFFSIEIHYHASTISQMLFLFHAFISVFN